MIPQYFKLMGHKVTVEVVAPKDWKHKDCVGFFDPNNSHIAIKRGKPARDAHVFAHELTHAILTLMSHPLNEQETFVDSFGGLLAQALSTARYAAPIRRKRK